MPSKAFLNVFLQIRRKERFASATVDEMAGRMFEAVTKAAIAKCVAFNVSAARKQRTSDAYMLVSNLRGVCEDLIVLSYISRSAAAEREEYVLSKLALETALGIAAQRAFFAANNPFQPVLGNNLSEAEVDQRLTSARQRMRSFWQALGHPNRDGPSVREMASSVGLASTYDYIYFLSSNFVHFNPQALLRTGWGPNEGPFIFSTEHMSAYYQTLSWFYGVVLFIGFYSAFSPEYFLVNWSDKLDHLIELLSDVQRWPEIVTLEEMNQRAPLFFLLHAARKVAQAAGEASPYGAILKEVRSLSRLRLLTP